MAKLRNLLKAAYRITGKSVLHRSRLKPGKAARAVWQRSMDEVAAKGISIVPEFWSAEACATARAEFDALVVSQLDNVWSDEAGSDHRIYGFDLVSDSGNKFLSDGEIRKMKEIYYKAPTAQLTEFAMMNRVEYREGNLGSGGGWHRDAVHEQQFKAILYLSDVGPDNGGFEYLINTHRKSSVYKTILSNDIGFAQDKFSEEEMKEILEDHGETYQRKTITGSAGTLILADTSGIHRGSPIADGSRYAITQYIFRSPAIGGRGIPELIKPLLVSPPSK